MTKCDPKDVSCAHMSCIFRANGTPHTVCGPPCTTSASAGNLGTNASPADTGEPKCQHFLQQSELPNGQNFTQISPQDPKRTASGRPGRLPQLRADGGGPFARPLKTFLAYIRFPSIPVNAFHRKLHFVESRRAPTHDRQHDRRPTTGGAGVA